jgi:predicted permease
MFILIALGLIFRKRGYLDGAAAQSVSTLLVDVIYPALDFTQMLRTVNAAALRELWYVPLLAMVVMLIALMTGILVSSLFCRKEAKPVISFLIMVFNWIYLPLPIIEGLFGQEGIKMILLANVGCQIMLWSVGIWTVQGTKPDWRSLKEIVVNPGLIATVIGILIAVLWKEANYLEMADIKQGGIIFKSVAIMVQALSMLGSLTIPLSLLLTGVQLGALHFGSLRFSKELFVIVLSRLVLAPLITIFVFYIAALIGLNIPLVQRMTLYLISLMPVAVTCSIITERYNSDTELAAKSIFYSTFLSILTVPIAYSMISFLGL